MIERHRIIEIMRRLTMAKLSKPILILSKKATNFRAPSRAYSICPLSNLLLLLGVVQPKGHSYAVMKLVILFCLVEARRIGILQITLSV